MLVGCLRVYTKAQPYLSFQNDQPVNMLFYEGLLSEAWMHGGDDFLGERELERQKALEFPSGGVRG